LAQAPQTPSDLPPDFSSLHSGTMAKMLSLILFAACLCQSYAVAVEPAKESSSSGIILLGGIVFLFALYYLVNSHITEVRTQTWSAISAAVSIFVAVMTNTMVNNLVRTKEEEGVEEKATTEKCCSLALQLFLTTFVVCLTLFLQRASELRLNAYGVIGGHILGFAAIDTFGTVAGMPAFSSSPWWTLVVVVIYVVAVQILVFPVKMTVKIFGKLCSGNNTDQKELDACEDQAADTANDFFCMGASFLLAMTIRGLIKGEVAGMEGEAKGRSSKDVTFLALAGIVFALLAGVVRAVQHKKGSYVALLDLLGTTASLTSAWCLLDAGNWHFMEKFEKDEILGHVAVALAASALFIVAMYVLAMVIKHVGADVKNTLKGEFTAVGLLLGLSWEHVFDAAIEGVEPYFPETETPRDASLLLSLFTLVLVLIVFPAWAVYILPKGNGKADEGLSPLTAFCDCSNDDEEESEDEEAGLE